MRLTSLTSRPRYTDQTTVGFKGCITVQLTRQSLPTLAKAAARNNTVIETYKLGRGVSSQSSREQKKGKKSPASLGLELMDETVAKMFKEIGLRGRVIKKTHHTRDKRPVHTYVATNDSFAAITTPEKGVVLYVDTPRRIKNTPSAVIGTREALVEGQITGMPKLETSQFQIMNHPILVTSTAVLKPLVEDIGKKFDISLSA